MHLGIASDSTPVLSSCGPESLFEMARRLAIEAPSASPPADASHAWYEYAVAAQSFPFTGPISRILAKAVARYRFHSPEDEYGRDCLRCCIFKQEGMERLYPSNVKHRNSQGAKEGVADGIPSTMYDVQATRKQFRPSLADPLFSFPSQTDTMLISPFLMYDIRVSSEHWAGGREDRRKEKASCESL